MKPSIAITTCVLTLFVLCTGWGFLVHRTINQLVVYQLPKSMLPFFYANMGYIVKNSIRPDRRRSFDSTEAPKHFIDAEMYGDSALWKMPRNWEDAVRKFSEDTLKKY